MSAYPDMPSSQEIIDQAIDYAAECAAQADPRYEALKAEKKAELQGGGNKGKKAERTVKMQMSTYKGKRAS